MKNFLILLCSIITTVGVCQEDETDTGDQTDSKTDKAEQMILDLHVDYLLDIPDNIQLEYYSRGASVNLLYDYPFGKGNVGLALGVALGAHNFFSDAAVVTVTDTTDNSSFTSFQPFDSDYSYKKNKLTVAYLDVPFELRFRTNENENGRRFKFFIGAKFGYRINTHGKLIDDSGKYKDFNIKNMNPFRYGATLRLAYGNIGLYGYYGLSTLFEEGKGVKVTPFSAGLSIYLF